ncbi:SMP-30/gluconolactonase/LRE family protein [Providencia sneebia]|uniref:Transcriptional regulator, IclR family protein n=1 Tax=Providencia sneebia DSM 19967 TaxID=1141660 RepID=K8WN05_9GAMM|nr:SMP-30/gluconolactonase/LRE family protein [Providencia sneebia]EKT57555.1 transcriptional regulator, IclR family protein [Providencia sneebia DSM 19967]
MNNISVAFASKAILGESPIWSPVRARLLWVDTLGASLNFFDPITSQNVEYALPSPLGFVVEKITGELIIGIGCHIELIDIKGKRQRIATAPHAHKNFRFNDAKLDSSGRLWVGLIDQDLKEGTGILYRFDPDGKWHTVDSGFTLINGISWSLDWKTLYVTDSRRGVIYGYDMDPHSGKVSNRRVVISINSKEGKPDGLIVDKHGFLLSVLFDGAAIARISPEGEIERCFQLPVHRPTSCTFADNEDYLYITSARLGLSETHLKTRPQSGSLLVLDYKRALGL